LKTDSSPLCRVEYRRDEVVEFLKRYQYPIEWTVPMFKDALIVRVFDPAGTIGYFWGTWASHGTMALHACVSSERSGAWLNRRTLDQLFQICFWLGADEVVTSLSQIPSRDRMRPLLLRLGFVEEAGDDDAPPLFIKDISSPNGRLPHAEQEGRGHNS